LVARTSVYPTSPLSGGLGCVLALFTIPPAQGALTDVLLGQPNHHDDIVGTHSDGILDLEKPIPNLLWLSAVLVGCQDHTHVPVRIDLDTSVTLPLRGALVRVRFKYPVITVDEDFAVHKHGHDVSPLVGRNIDFIPFLTDEPLADFWDDGTGLVHYKQCPTVSVPQITLELRLLGFGIRPLTKTQHS
jgi:hypothetical protein